MKDELGDRIDMLDSIKMNRLIYSNSTDGHISTDIAAVSYFSDGHFLNATLWLGFPLNVNIFQDGTIVNYGMLVDADSNNNTGWGGVDYKIQNSWRNGTWTRTFEEWSSTGLSRLLSGGPNNPLSPSNSQTSYFPLYADLDSMGSPDKYRVVFFLEEQNMNRSIWNIDFSKWIHIPPPDIATSVSPNPLVLRAGESKQVELQIKSNTGFQPIVSLSVVNPSQGINASFISANESKTNTNAFRMNPYGLITTSMQINALSNLASYAPYTLIVSATASFPPDYYVPPYISNSFVSNLKRLSFLQGDDENRTTQSTMTIQVNPPVSPLEQFESFWSGINPIVSPMIGLIGLVSGWRIGRGKKRKDGKIDEFLKD
jgi:hypothetical protein